MPDELRTFLWQRLRELADHMRNQPEPADGLPVV
jgi:hypothetical protein